MNYKKRLNEMNEAEIQVCIMSLFRAPQNEQKRTREQNGSLIESWLHAMRLTTRHEFLFHRDETGDLWLLNRDQSNCPCCRQQAPTKTQPSKQPEKSRPKQGLKSVSPRIQKSGPDSQVTVVTIQPQRQTHSAATSKQASRQTSPNLHRRQIPNRPEKSRSCWRDCCAECSSICSNLFS